MTTTHHWTEMETEYVINNYPRLSSGRIGIQLGIDAKKVERKVYNLKRKGLIKGNYQKWLNN